ncbi:MAG: hypothetical protein R3F49_00510 [Planctomycetota bacterium]
MRALLSVCMAVVGFVSANRLVVALRPWPADYGLGAKVAHLAQHAGSYDVLLIGSSATYYGLRPRTIEAALAARGQRARVFNLGVGGMGSYEQVYLLRWVLERMRPKLVLYEEPRFDPLLWYPDVRNPRYIHWHDVAMTLEALRGLAFVDAPPDYKAQDYAATWHGDWKLATALEHVELCAMRATALGDGPRIAARWLGLAAPLRPTETELEAESGWLDIGAEPDPGALRQHERFRADRASWDARVADIRAQNEGRVDLAVKFDQRAFEALRALLDASGAQVIWYATPRAVGDPTLATLAASGALAPYLPDNRPEFAPELYDPDVRWDPNHLDAAGAERFSLRLAGDVADLLDTTRSRDEVQQEDAVQPAGGR